LCGPSVCCRVWASCGLCPLARGQFRFPSIQKRKRKDTYDSACQYKKLQIIVPLFNEKTPTPFFYWSSRFRCSIHIKLQTKSIFILSLFWKKNWAASATFDRALMSHAKISWSPRASQRFNAGWRDYWFAHRRARPARARTVAIAPASISYYCVWI